VSSGITTAGNSDPLRLVDADGEGVLYIRVLLPFMKLKFNIADTDHIA
jgi:hypothetical protein